MERHEVTINRKALLGVVEMALRVQGKQKKDSPLPPICRCVAIEWCAPYPTRARATSLATWYSGTLYPDTEKIIGEGNVALNAAELREILRSSRAVDVTIRSLSDRLTVELEIGDSTITLPDRDGSTMPAAPGGGPLDQSSPLLDLPMPQLRRLCAQASYPVPADVDGSVAALVGVRPDSIVMSATDGHRLAVSKLRLWSDRERVRDVLLPAAALRLLASVKAECRATVRHLPAVGAATPVTRVEIGKSETLTISSPTLGTFPGVESLLERHRRSAFAVVDREALIGAVSRASVIGMSVVLSLRSGSVEVLAADDLGHAMRERLLAHVEHTADDPNVSGSAVNPQYLLDVLAVVDTDRVELTFGWVDEPLLIAPFGAGCSNEAQQHLIMPRTDRPETKATKPEREPLPAVSTEQLAAAMREQAPEIDPSVSVSVSVGGGEPVEVWPAEEAADDHAADPDPEAVASQVDASELPEDSVPEPPEADFAEAAEEPAIDEPEPLAPGRYRALPSSGAPPFEIVLREVNGELFGRTPEAERSAASGEPRGPGVRVSDLIGYRFERIAA